MIAGLVIGGVLWLGMAGVSCYGWLTLPAAARIPVHFGAGYNNFMPKPGGLLVWPAAGALIYVLFAVIGARGGGSVTHVILPLVMCLLLAVQAGAIRVARRTAGPRQ